MVVLYRKYRPQKLTDLVGQEQIKNALLTAFSVGKISHAYLFTGPKGTGKTTTARILAKMLNCQNNKVSGVRFQVSEKNSKKDTKTLDLKPETYGEPCNKCDACLAISNGTYLDVLEIDAASNRLIDDVRELREKIKLAPTFGRYKIYILDEVHMLTTEAFNALLKTLEEPPEHTVFILCTTLVAKLPQTIISRCQRFDFKKATEEDIVTYLKSIAKEEKIEVEVKALSLIAKEASGGYRDAVSLFDQLVSAKTDKKLTEADVKQNIFAGDENLIKQFIQLLVEKNLQSLVNFIKEKNDDGVNWSAFLKKLLASLEEILWQKITGEKVLVSLTIEELKKLLKLFLEAEKETKFSVITQLPIELAVIEWCEGQTTVNREQLTDNSKQRTEKSEEKTNPSYSSSPSTSLRINSATTPESRKADSGQALYRTVTGQARMTKEKVEKEETTNADTSRLSLEDFQRQWKDILKAVKPYNHSVEALLRSCEPTDFDGKSLHLSVYYKFHKDRLSDIKVKELVEKVLQDLFGNPIKVNCTLSEKTKKAVAQDDLASQAEEIFQ